MGTTKKALRAAAPGFTPGPWEVWTEHARVYAGPATQNTPSTMSGIRGCIAECDEDDWGADEDEGAAIAQANARLIAAAPELYEVVRKLVTHEAPPDMLWERARRALLLASVSEPAERSDAPSIPNSSPLRAGGKEEA